MLVYSVINPKVVMSNTGYTVKLPTTANVIEIDYSYKFNSYVAEVLFYKSNFKYVFQIYNKNKFCSQNVLSDRSEYLFSFVKNKLTF